MAATRNWYQCPVFNRSRIVACDFVEIWRIVHGLNLDSRYLGPSKCRSSTKYLTSLFPVVDSLTRWVLELCQVNRTKLFFCCLICIFSGITGKSEKNFFKNFSCILFYLEYTFVYENWNAHKNWNNFEKWLEI